MRELTSENTADYLGEMGRVPQGIPIAVRELSGGVSNVVLRVDVRGQAPFVIKQCRERLRVAMDCAPGLIASGPSALRSSCWSGYCLPAPFPRFSLKIATSTFLR